VAFTGGALLLARQPSPVKPRLDIPGALLVSSAVFCLVYGFSNAATHTWATRPPTGSWHRPGAGRSVRAWQRRAAHPLLPHGWCSTATACGAYLSNSSARPGCSGLLVLTYYLQQTLGYSPLVTGFAFLPISGGLIVMANLSTIVLMPDSAPSRWSHWGC